MATTRLKRKDRKNKARANNRVERIKQLLSVPVIKNVDPEELKAQFSNNGGKSASANAEPKAKKTSAPKAEASEETETATETSGQSENSSDSENKGE